MILRFRASSTNDVVDLLVLPFTRMMFPSLPMVYGIEIETIELPL
jgi:hypothetical protein